MSLALALKAEIVFGLQLVTRHRAPRLAGLLAASLVFLLLTGDPSEATLEVRRRTLVLIAGTLAGVAGSRLLAYGGPLAAARRAASPRLLVPVGRLLGLLLLGGPVLLGASIVLIGGRWGALPAVHTATIATAYAAAASVAVVALTPALGASVAAGLGLIAAFLGGVAPSAVAHSLAAWPLARAPAVLLWNVLPLPWRATRWLTEGASHGDPVVLVAWLLAGAALGAWSVERFAEHAGVPEGPP